MREIPFVNSGIVKARRCKRGFSTRSSTIMNKNNMIKPSPTKKSAVGFDQPLSAPTWTP